jgi:mannose-6-phosphate isomerase-like protein (cupin superfamily)
MSIVLPNQDAGEPSYFTPRALHVPAGKGLVKWVSGDAYEIKTTNETTNGSMSFIDARVPPGNGPAAHVHNSSDETFYIVSGALEMLNGDQTFIAESGDLVFVPRGTRHRFRNIGGEETHMIFLFTPGGPEAMFVEVGDDPVPGEQPQLWPVERFLSHMPIIERADIDTLLVPEETDLPPAAEEA